MQTVFIASALRERHPDVHFALKLALDDAGVPLVEIPATNQWIRDWAPIRCGDHYTLFRGHTATPANIARWPALEVTEATLDDLCLAAGIGLGGVPMRRSHLVLDGGNVARSPDGKWVLMTTMAMRDNGPKFQDKWFEEILKAEIIWLPPEPGDTLGHIDGICSWRDDNTVLLNDYRSLRDPTWAAYWREVQAILWDQGINTLDMPYAYDECRELTEERFRREFPDADDFNPCYGYFSNALILPEVVIYPKYSIPKDRQAEDAFIDAFPGVQCMGIDCSHLSYEGGAVHCVTWTDG